MIGFRSLVAGAVLAGSGVAAFAAPVTVYDTSLANLNGAYGGGTATTGAAAAPYEGKVTTVTGPGGSANRADGTAVADQWVQRGVGGGGAVGITTQYARNGNGSAYFSGANVTDGTYKADLELFFGTAVSASSITGLSYDWFRSGTSTATDHFHPSMRLIVMGQDATGAPKAGYLVYERAYNPSVSPVPTDVWTSENLIDANLWGTGSLPGAFSVYNRDLSDWDAVLDNLMVVGLSIGIGSGWNNGGFEGAVDNVSFTAGGVNTVWNFEVAANAVPEPGSLALVGLGLAGVVALRKRKAG